MSPLAAISILAGLACLGLARHYAVRFPDERAIAVGTPRSGQWRTMERKWLALHPTCAACGTTKDVVPHHKAPFHLHPELELDPNNLVSLCNSHGCHFLLGHGCDWQAFNPHVEEDARFQSRRIAQRKYE